MAEAIAMNRKYSALPDLDTAPDIYETPELTDDNSTVLTTTGRSPSDDESEADDDEAGISRSHLQVDQARSRFLGSDVDARGVDFSDRVDGKRKAYRTASRRGRDANELGDLSDEEDDDNLERTIARLKRQVEEAKEAYNRQQAEAGTATPGAAVPNRELDALSQALADIARLPSGETRRPAAAAAAAPIPGETSAAAAAATPAGKLAPAHTASQQAADFDRRLLMLERSIGIGSSALPELDGLGSGSGSGGSSGSSGALPRAILPTLDGLQRQIATLADASTASLDGISRRVRALTQEADELAKARRAAKAAHEALVQAGVKVDEPVTASTGAGAADADADSDAAKIHALYGTLPTIEALTPLLPPLLDRLRSLRAIHADAAGAGALLDSLAQRQAETAAEVRQWREGLDKIEAAVRDGTATLDSNRQVMEGWVRALEGRLDKL